MAPDERAEGSMVVLLAVKRVMVVTIRSDPIKRVMVVISEDVAGAVQRTMDDPGPPHWRNVRPAVYYYRVTEPRNYGD